MTEERIMEVLREMMLVCMKIAGPLLLISIVVGLIIAIFQAATQIHEQTLTFVPKLILIVLLLLLMGSFIGVTMRDFVFSIFDLMASVE